MLLTEVCCWPLLPCGQWALSQPQPCALLKSRHPIWHSPGAQQHRCAGCHIAPPPTGSPVLSGILVCSSYIGLLSVLIFSSSCAVSLEGILPFSLPPSGLCAALLCRSQPWAGAPGTAPPCTAPLGRCAGPPQPPHAVGTAAVGTAHWVAVGTVPLSAALPEVSLFSAAWKQNRM